MTLTWIKDDKCFADAIVYSLKDNRNIELAWLYFDNDLNKWISISNTSDPWTDTICAI